MLGAALTDPEAFPQVADLLTRGDFSLEKHRRIFDAAAAVYARGEEPDSFSVGNELLRATQLKSIDGPSYLSDLTDGIPRLVNLSGYCDIVRTAAVKREAITAMGAMIQHCYDPGEDASDLLGDVERVTESPLLRAAQVGSTDDGSGGERRRRHHRFSFA